MVVILCFIKIIVRRLGLLQWQPKPQLQKEAEEKYNSGISISRT